LIRKRLEFCKNPLGCAHHGSSVPRPALRVKSALVPVSAAPYGPRRTARLAARMAARLGLMTARS
jgi:hypothetical protein